MAKRIGNENSGQTQAKLGNREQTIAVEEDDESSEVLTEKLEEDVIVEKLYQQDQERPQPQQISDETTLQIYPMKPPSIHVQVLRSEQDLAVEHQLTPKLDYRKTMTMTSSDLLQRKLRKNSEDLEPKSGMRRKTPKWTSLVMSKSFEIESNEGSSVVQSRGRRPKKQRLSKQSNGSGSDKKLRFSSFCVANTSNRKTLGFSFGNGAASVKATRSAQSINQQGKGLGQSTPASSYKDLMPNPEYTSKGVVWICAEHPVISAATQVLVGLVQLRNLLVNMTYSKYTFLDQAYLQELERMMKKVWKVKMGMLRSGSLSKFIMTDGLSVDSLTPGVLISQILTSMIGTLRKCWFDSTSLSKLFTTSCLHKTWCLPCQTQDSKTHEFVSFQCISLDTVGNDIQTHASESAPTVCSTCGKELVTVWKLVTTGTFLTVAFATPQIAPLKKRPTFTIFDRQSSYKIHTVVSALTKPDGLYHVFQKRGVNWYRFSEKSAQKVSLSEVLGASYTCLVFEKEIS